MRVIKWSYLEIFEKEKAKLSSSFTRSPEDCLQWFPKIPMYSWNPDSFFALNGGIPISVFEVKTQSNLDFG